MHRPEQLLHAGVTNEREVVRMLGVDLRETGRLRHLVQLLGNLAPQDQRRLVRFLRQRGEHDTLERHPGARFLNRGHVLAEHEGRIQ